MRPPAEPRIAGYDGLADPEHRELFVEIDAVGADHRLRFNAKQMVASRYFYQGISPRFDDGYLGGGQRLEDKEIVPFSDLEKVYKPAHFWQERRGFFRYALFVDKMEDELFGIGVNGRADLYRPNRSPQTPATNLMVSRSTMLGQFSAIVLIHELGHTLGLCHPIGTKEPPIPSPICPVPTGWEEDNEHCVHYCGVDGNDVTAMGDDVGRGVIIAGAARGALIGAAIGALAGGVGAVVGGIVGGIVGAVDGFLNSDAWLRVVDYHPNEWAALQFGVFPSVPP